MTVKRLEGLRMRVESQSFADAMYAVLSHRGWWTLSKPMLAGMTVTAFRFTLQKRLAQESPSAYNWMAENFLAADFIGVTASQSAGFTFDRTFPLYRRHAVAELKRSIDHSVGAVMWHDGFVAVTGYDDDRASLLFDDGSGAERELPYERFGMNASPYWYVQTYSQRIGLDPVEVIKESLIQAVYKWETHDPILPANEYACGRAAYGLLLNALLSGDYCPAGASAALSAYAAHKRDLEAYSHALLAEWPAAEPVAEQYAAAAAAFTMLERLFHENGSADGEPHTSGHRRRLHELAEEARQAEEAAILAVKSLLGETIGNRFHDIGLR